MKVGDLVVLSAYARKLKQFYSGRDEDVGMIYEQRIIGCYSVIWASDGKKSIHVDRRDLKYAKIKKQYTS